MEQILCNEYHDGGYGTKRNHDIMGRRLSDALSLTLRNLANFQILSEESNGRCPRDVYICASPFTDMALSKRLCVKYWYRGWCAFTYRRGPCVARSTVLGNAKASIRRTSNENGSHAFFIFVYNQN